MAAQQPLSNHGHLMPIESSHTLDARGPRGALTAEKARELAAPVLVGGRGDIRRLVLSTWAFSVEAAEVFAQAIAKLPKLESAVLADIIAGRPEAEGLAVYRALGTALKDQQLVEIDLSDNAVGPKGVEACREFLTGQEKLERLFFCNCGISAEAARSIADILLFRTPTVLTTLHFWNNMSGNGGAIAIADMVAASPALRDFRFSSSRGGNDGGVALAKALRHTPLLEALDLEDNTFGLPGARAMGATLASGAAGNLRHLNLADTATGDEGAAALASGIVRGCAARLEVLKLGANELTSEDGPGAAAVARCLRRLTSLRLFDVSDNPDLGDVGARMLARAVRRRAAFRAAAGAQGPDPLAEIRVGECGFTGRGALALVQAAVACLPCLARIELGGNEISVAGIARLREALEAAPGKPLPFSVLTGLDEEEAENVDDDEEEGDGECYECYVTAVGA